MYSYQYPRPAVTADILLFGDHATRILLIKRRNDPFKDCWAFPGGFFDMDDPNIEYTALRELAEETGLTGIALTEVGVASRDGRDPRGRTISVIFKGEVECNQVHPIGGDDAKEACWFPLDELPNLAFDHSEILAKALKLDSTANPLETETTSRTEHIPLWKRRKQM